MDPGHLAFVVISGFLSITLGFSWLGLWPALLEWMLLVLLLLLLLRVFSIMVTLFPVAISLFGRKFYPSSSSLTWVSKLRFGRWAFFFWLFGVQIFTLDEPTGHFDCSGLDGQKLGGDEMLPSFVWQVIKMLGACSIPVGLLLIGGNISDLMKGFKFSEGYKGTFIDAVRLVVVPALLFTLGRPISEGMEWIRKALIV